MRQSTKHAKHRKKWRLISFYQSLKENAFVKVLEYLIKMVEFVIKLKIAIAILNFTLQVSAKIISWIIPYVEIIYHFLSQVTSLFCCFHQGGTQSVLEKLSTLWGEIETQIVVSFESPDRIFQKC